jgi:hypothetical protein
MMSPDGRWRATADTVQNGGFGNAEIHTTVFLQEAFSNSGPKVVLVVECDGPMARPYVLDNEANKGGCIGLTMRWEAAKKLSLTFNAKRGTDAICHVTKIAEVDILTKTEPGDVAVDKPPSQYCAGDS